MACGNLPLRYLGVPLNSRKLSLASSEPLLHQIKARFSSWSTKTLSFAGRLLLIKTVISGITNFWCSSFVLPKACVGKINSMCSTFLWRGNLDARNNARVAWETVTKPKEEGGIRSEGPSVMEQSLLFAVDLAPFLQTRISVGFLVQGSYTQRINFKLLDHKSFSEFFLVDKQITKA